MKPYLHFGMLMMIFLLSSCAIVGGIFKAGVLVGVLIVLFIIAFIIWLTNRNSGKP
jgi:formate hydrogenlyase subunit 4